MKKITNANQCDNWAKDLCDCNYLKDCYLHKPASKESEVCPTCKGKHPEFCSNAYHLKPIDVKEPEVKEQGGEWISVEDRLPENRNWCLVMSNNELFLACYKHGIFETEKPEILHSVTHWMPLPSPPKSI